MPLEDFPRHFSRRFPDLPGNRVVVALSGGPDSVALLHLLRDPSLGLELEAAHVHHATRGIEADRDAAFCECLCDRLGIPFHLLRIQTESNPHDGREGAWRRHRYRVLLDLARDRSAAAVATAHHRDDVAEGVVLQLLRGAGPRALAGIRETTDHNVIRPLLDWRRAEILDWLNEHGIGWIEDSSNQDLGHLRNRVRHTILAELRAVSPRIDDHLVNLASALAEDEAWFASELERRAIWIEPWQPDGGVLLDALLGLPRPVRTRWLHAQAARTGIGRVTRRQLELFHGLVEHGSPRSVSLAGRWTLRLAGSRLWLEPPASPDPYLLDLKEGHDLPLSIPGWRIRLTRDAPEPEGETWRFTVSSDAHLTVRTPAPGDTVVNHGKPAKVAELMARSVPRHLRPAWPLLCENAKIAWIPGVWQGPCSGNLLVEVLTDG